MNKILEVTGLCKTYIVNKVQNNVLMNVNLSINEGEMVAIMGPSGSGKSTLLYTVSGMDTATAGKIDFCGTDIAKMDKKELSNMRLNDMGFIFQQMYMLKNLTILDNIILPACESVKLQETKKETVKRAEILMRKIGILEIADNDITEASGGELQRACICRSIINKPKMIFADEPTGALNRTASLEIMLQLKKINEEGTTILLVTHDVRVASACQKVLFIVDGNIKGEYNLDENIDDEKQREKLLNSWLIEMGW